MYTTLDNYTDISCLSDIFIFENEQCHVFQLQYRRESATEDEMAVEAGTAHVGQQSPIYLHPENITAPPEPTSIFSSPDIQHSFIINTLHVHEAHFYSNTIQFNCSAIQSSFIKHLVFITPDLYLPSYVFSLTVVHSVLLTCSITDAPRPSAPTTLQLPKYTFAR